MRERWRDLRCGERPGAGTRGWRHHGVSAPGGKSGNPHDRIIALNKIKKIINTCLGTMFLSKLSLGDRGQLREVRGRLDLVESGDCGDTAGRWQTIEIINFIKIANLDFCEFVEKEQTTNKNQH